MADRDEHGRRPDDPLYGEQQPMSANERDFSLLLDYLEEQSAPAEVVAALSGLNERWRRGREANRKRDEAYRELRERLGETG